MTEKDNVYFITSKLEMLPELLKSMAEGNTIGIWSDALGQGMFLCTVKDVLHDEDENDIVIILNENEITTPRANSYVLYLKEIDRIFTFIVQPLVESNPK